MNLVLAAQAVNFSPITLFMDADWVVKAVIIGLALSSIWAWTIIISFTLKMGRINSQTEKFERDFWASSDIDGFYNGHNKKRPAPGACLYRRG